MTQDTTVVVGDRFTEFLSTRGTISASELSERLRAGEVAPGTVIVAGQGIPAAQREELDLLAGPAGADVRFAGSGAPTAGRWLTHKHVEKNEMITAPERAGENRFVAALLVDAHADTLEDHLTGHHIPGIALTEAARQTWTAVTERFFLGETSPKVRFVLGSFSSTFHRYVFPLPATVEYTLLDRTQNAMEQVFCCRVAVRQNDAVAAEIDAEYRVIDERISARQEAMAARAAVSAELARHAREGADAVAP
ncbi:AfsA-related hotdog domain-containing protein [Nocardiopsis sediminis]|uniref:AfsA-related hotdog domain-containing protein n=1 Tax=Nocardiopsis sediminis TaxID=1778267 RepID=A0ABV8FHG8_9ACTN